MSKFANNDPAPCIRDFQSQRLRVGAGVHAHVQEARRNYAKAVSKTERPCGRRLKHRNADFRKSEWLIRFMFINQLPGRPLLNLHHCASRYIAVPLAIHVSPVSFLSIASACGRSAFEREASVRALFASFVIPARIALTPASRYRRSTLSTPPFSIALT